MQKLLRDGGRAPDEPVAAVDDESEPRTSDRAVRASADSGPASSRQAIEAVIEDEAVEVLNPEHVLATLTENVPFVMEMVVENGRGYIPATGHSQNIQEIGIIPIDAVYSPVVRVRYGIEETRVGQRAQDHGVVSGE